MPAASGGTNSPRPGATAPNEHINHIRAQLMQGFGAGADQRTVTALTRDRRILGGRPTVVGLERLARHTVRARGDTRGQLERAVDAARKATMMLSVAVVIVEGVVNIFHRRRNRRP